MKSNNRPKTASAPAKSEQKDLPKVSSPKQMPQAASMPDPKNVKAKTAAEKVDKTPLKAAKGDDDLMSLPQRKS